MKISAFSLRIFESSRAWRKPSNKVTFQHIRFFIQAYPNNLIGFYNLMLWHLAVGELSHPLSINWWQWKWILSLKLSQEIDNQEDKRWRKVSYFLLCPPQKNQSFQQKCFDLCFLENLGRTSQAFQRKTDWLKHQVFKGLILSDLTDKNKKLTKSKKMGSNLMQLFECLLRLLGFQIIF